MSCNIQNTGFLEYSLVRCGKTLCEPPSYQIVATLGCVVSEITSATTLVSVRNTQVFRTALMALTEPRTLWRRIPHFPSPGQRVVLHSISKMHCSHWSERMWSVNLDASISGVSDPRRAFLLAFRITGSADDKPGSTWERRRHVWEHLESQSCIQFVFSLYSHLCIYVSMYV